MTNPSFLNSAKVPPFRTVNFTDSATSRFQDNVATVLSAILGIGLLNHVIIQNVALKTTDTTIYHGLGRPAQGYFVVKSTAATVPFTSANDRGLDNSIILNGSASATVTLLIF